METRAGDPGAFARFDLTRVPSPAFVVDAAKIRANLTVLRQIGDASGARVLAALKAFSMWSLGPTVADYLDGVCASAAFGVRLLSFQRAGPDRHPPRRTPLCINHGRWHDLLAWRFVGCVILLMEDIAMPGDARPPSAAMHRLRGRRMPLMLSVETRLVIAGHAFPAGLSYGSCCRTLSAMSTRSFRRALPVSSSSNSFGSTGSFVLRIAI